MRKLLAVFFMVTFIGGYARTVTHEEAAAAAAEFFNSYLRPTSNDTQKKVRGAVLANVFSGNGTQPYYVFNADGNEGFVIISGDDRRRMVLGYSDSGSFDIDNIPPQLSGLLDRFSRNVDAIPDSLSSDCSWRDRTRSGSETEGVLLETVNWGQGYPYNLTTPTRDGVHCLTGCIPTAMAIVMQYHKWPEVSRGSRLREDFKELDFSGITFDWECMAELDKEEGQLEVSKLMRHIGRVMNVAYSPYLSLASNEMLGRYMHEFFSYSFESQTIFRNNFEDDVWFDLLTQEIKSGRPVIYSDMYRPNGHNVFVCDGYNDIGYHINWGWDGVSNGYFDLQTLFGNDRGQSMSLRLAPTDYDTDKYSPVFIDKGYKHGFGLLYDACGLNISNVDIEPNKPFDMTIGQVEIDDKQYSARIGLALMDENDQIKAMAKYPIPPGYENYGFDEYFGMDITTGENVWEGSNYFTSEMNAGTVYFDCDNIASTDRVQLVSRRLMDPDKEQDFWYDHEYMEDNWKIIAGTLETPSWRPVRGNKPVVSKVSFKYPEGFPSDAINKDTCVLRNCDYHFFIEHPRGLTTVDINGESTSVYYDSSGSEISIRPILDEYNVNIGYVPYARTTSLTIDVPSPGSLGNMLADLDVSTVISMTIRGDIDIRDLLAISEASLQIEQLDLSECNIVAYGSFPANTVPTVWDAEKGIPGGPIESITIRELILPESLEYVQLHGIACRNLHTLALPSSLKHIEGEGLNYMNCENGISSLSLRTVVCKNKVPFDLDDYGIRVTTYGRDDMDVYPTTLVVPTGTRDLYANSDGWNNFTNIVEMDEPCTFDKVIDGVRYIGVGETAELYNCYFWDTPQHLIIPDHIIHEGKEFKVTRIAQKAIWGSQVMKSENHIKFVTLNKSLKDISREFGTMTDTYYALNVVPIKDWRSFTPKTAVYNPYMYENLIMPNIEDYGFTPVTFFVPGKFPIDKKAFKEMWVYELDKTNGIVKIRPKINDLVIDEVNVNGEVISPEKDLYHFNVNSDVAPDVRVTYTLHNRQTMTTHYDGVFNSALPNIDLTADAEVLIESLTVDPAVWTGPEGTGFRLNVTVYPENATDQTLEYESTDKSIATMDDYGYVRIHKAGSCKILVMTTDGSALTAECLIIGISDVDAIFADEAVVDVYNLNGILVRSGCTKDQLQQLPPSMYILRNGIMVVKTVVR